jgi:hypothetical protein
MILFCPVMGEMISIYKFKSIKIPFPLKFENSILEKGEYAFEIVIDQKPQIFFLRILKKGKILCQIQGEKLEEYKSYGWDRFKDPDIPGEPTFKMKKNPEEKAVNIIFESGKNTAIYPFVKIKFKMEYE